MTATTASVSIARAAETTHTNSRTNRRGTFGFSQPTRLIWAIAVLLTLATPLTFGAAGPGVLPGDVAVANALHGWFSGWLGGPIAFVNVLGRAPVAIALSGVVAALLFYRRWATEAALVASAGLAWAGNITLKLLAESPRPTTDLVTISEHADGYGFPSGHVMGTTVLLGTLFIVATRRIDSGPLRRLAQLAALTTLAITGIARIEVGAHWPSDVVGGYLWGTILLLTIVTVQSNWSSVTSATAAIVIRIPILRRQASVTESPS